VFNIIIQDAKKDALEMTHKLFWLLHGQVDGNIDSALCVCIYIYFNEYSVPGF